MRIPNQKHTTRIKTQTQSAFNLLKRVGFAVLFALSATHTLHAQQIIWERDGEADSSRYGREILPLGDQNLDGFDDFAVQAFGVGPQGTDEGVWLDLFHGGNPPSTTPYMRIDTPPDGIWTGDIWTLDFNGDGFVDVMFTGNIKIYFGGPNLDTIPDVVWNGQRRDTETAKRPIGDINGDGFDDFTRYDFITGGGDSTEVFWGGVPFDTLPDLVLHSPPNQIGRASPDTYGDLNGDGIDDFITTTYPGADMWLYIYHGSTVPDTIPEQEIFIEGQQHVHVDIVPDLNGDGKDDLILFGDDGWPNDYHVFLGGDVLSSTPDFNLESECLDRLDEARNYGPEISGAGDTNNDGINDLLIVGPNCPNWGIGSLYLGYFWLNPLPVWNIRGRQGPYDLIGIRYAAGVGDINNDGFDDVAFGAFNTDFDGLRGRVIVIAGQTRQVPIDELPIEVPSGLEVSVYPNPFNSTTTLRLNLPIGARNVTLTVSNILGQQVEHKEIEVLAPQVEIQLTADNWPSGIYLARAEALNKSQTTKLVLLK